MHEKTPALPLQINLPIIMHMKNFIANNFKNYNVDSTEKRY